MYHHVVHNKLLYFINFLSSFVSFSVTTCSGDQFRCLDGICLSIDKRCNGIADCRNGEDESQCGKLICFLPLSLKYVLARSILETSWERETEYINEIFNNLADFDGVWLVCLRCFCLCRLWLCRLVDNMNLTNSQLIVKSIITFARATIILLQRFQQ